MLLVSTSLSSNAFIFLFYPLFYRRRRSIPSLAGGLVTGVLFGTSAYLLKKNADWGLELALAGSAVLAAGSVPRAIRLQKPVPIFLAVLAGVNGVYYSKKYWEFYG